MAAVRRRSLAALAAGAVAVCFGSADAAPPPDHDAVLATMRRATEFMVEKVAYRGGYVWTYLPDLSRRWGELEARETMIWLQAPGTSSMGQLFLDAYHATGDEYYYRAAERAADALIWGQHPSGGWNYLIDFAGERSLREWYDTIGRAAWRMEEFQHYYGNATFDDQSTTDAARFLLRLYLEKLDPKYRPALDRAIQFVLDSQYPIGGWPQRYPLRYDFSKQGNPDYTHYITFNDGVIAENVDFLIECYRTLGDPRLLDPIIRGMNVFLVTQQGPPQAGWALQYTLDLKPAGARTYEPRALATHTTAANVEQLLKFYRLTGETKFLARVPEALDWLDSVRLPPGTKAPPGRTHPTFVEIGTNRPLYVHRKGSSVVDGRYYVDYDPHDTIDHYSAFRRIDVAALRAEYERLRAIPPEKVVQGSPLVPAPGAAELPRFVTMPSAAAVNDPRRLDDAVGEIVASLNREGYWPAELELTSRPYRGLETDTSPYPAEKPMIGISTAVYIENMATLIRWLETRR